MGSLKSQRPSIFFFFQHPPNQLESDVSNQDDECFGDQQAKKSFQTKENPKNLGWSGK